MLILDTAALIALERNDRAMWRRLNEAVLAGQVPRTHAGVLGQAWRGGPRQAQLARALNSIDIVPLDAALGRRSGVLLAKTGKADVIDAAVVLLSEDGDVIVTSDHADLIALAEAAERDVELIHP